MDLGLRGKSVLITGGSKGIGFACAEAFASEGVSLLHIAARNGSELEEARRRLEDKYQAKVAHHSVDLTVHDDLERLAAACSDIDILINNAGSIPGGTLLEIDEKKWRQAWELKVFGYINLTRLIYESMIRRRSGVVVNIIGLGGERHRPQYIAGCSGNSALMAFTRALGAESVDHGVRIVGINPGRTLTDRQLAHLKEAAEREYGSPERWTDVRDGIAKQLPLGRFISTEDISNLVLFLASERAAYISATVVTLDGGQSLSTEDVNAMEASVALLEGGKLHVEVDDFADPWIKSETALLVHGLAESGEAWRAWVPTLGRKLRVVRPDLRGFGRSTPMPRDFPWSLDILADDLAHVIEDVAGDPVHVVGAKIGATASVRLAARRPELVKSLTVIGLPVKGSSKRPGLDPESHGVRAWARSSMEERLGDDASEAMLEWWSDLMGRTALSTLLGFSQATGSFDVSEDLERLRCRVLAITSDSPRHPVSESESWRRKIWSSKLVVVPGDGYHAAAIHPDLCAKAALEFIEQSRAQPS